MMVTAGLLSIVAGLLLLAGVALQSRYQHRVIGRHEIGHHVRGVIREDSGLAILDGQGVLGPGYVLFMDGTAEFIGLDAHRG
jgi:hypothetical protein